MTTRAFAVPALVLVVALATGLAACAVDNPEILITGVCAQDNDTADKCSTPAGKCSLYLTGYAWLDAAVDYTLVGGVVEDNSLDFFLEITNPQPPNANTDPAVGAVNTRNAIVDTIKVSYDVPGLTLPSVSYPSFGPLVSASGSATHWATLMPAAVVNQLAGAVAVGAEVALTANVRLAGAYQDGTKFETRPYVVMVHFRNRTFTVLPCATAGQLPYYCPHAGQTAGFVCK